MRTRRKPPVAAGQNFIEKLLNNSDAIFNPFSSSSSIAIFSAKVPARITGSARSPGTCPAKYIIQTTQINNRGVQQFIKNDNSCITLIKNPDFIEIDIIDTIIYNNTVEADTFVSLGAQNWWDTSPSSSIHAHKIQLYTFGELKFRLKFIFGGVNFEAALALPADGGGGGDTPMVEEAVDEEDWNDPSISILKINKWLNKNFKMFFKFSDSMQYVEKTDPTIGSNPVLYNGLQIWREQYCPNIYIPCGEEDDTAPGCDGNSSQLCCPPAVTEVHTAGGNYEYPNYALCGAGSPLYKKDFISMIEYTGPPNISEYYKNKTKKLQQIQRIIPSFKLCLYNGITSKSLDGNLKKLIPNKLGQKVQWVFVNSQTGQSGAKAGMPIALRCKYVKGDPGLWDNALEEYKLGEGYFSDELSVSNLGVATLDTYIKGPKVFSVKGKTYTPSITKNLITIQEAARIYRILVFLDALRDLNRITQTNARDRWKEEHNDGDEPSKDDLEAINQASSGASGVSDDKLTKILLEFRQSGWELVDDMKLPAPDITKPYKWISDNVMEELKNINLNAITYNSENPEEFITVSIFIDTETNFITIPNPTRPLIIPTSSADLIIVKGREAALPVGQKWSEGTCKISGRNVPVCPWASTPSSSACLPAEGPCSVDESDQQIFSALVLRLALASGGVRVSRAQFDIRPDNCTPSFGGMTQYGIDYRLYGGILFPPLLEVDDADLAAAATLPLQISSIFGDEFWKDLSADLKSGDPSPFSKAFGKLNYAGVEVLLNLIGSYNGSIPESTWSTDEADEGLIGELGSWSKNEATDYKKNYEECKEKLEGVAPVLNNILKAEQHGPFDDDEVQNILRNVLLAGFLHSSSGGRGGVEKVAQLIMEIWIPPGCANTFCICT